MSRNGQSDMPLNNTPNPQFERDVRSTFAQQTFMRMIGAKITGLSAGSVEISLPCRDNLLQHHGYLHGAVIAAIVDTACGCSAMDADAAGFDGPDSGIQDQLPCTSRGRTNCRAGSSRQARSQAYGVLGRGAIDEGRDGKARGRAGGDHGPGQGRLARLRTSGGVGLPGAFAPVCAESGPHELSTLTCRWRIHARSDR